MRRTGISMVCIGLVVAMGCGDDTRTGEDAGGIRLPDGSAPASCDPITVPAPTAAACAAATGACISGCTGTDPGACIVACFEADPNPDPCFGCFIQSIDACYTSRGCNDEYGRLDCCAADMCVEGSPCVDEGGPCVAQWDTYNACGDALTEGSCNGVANVCFPPAGGFLPDLSPRPAISPEAERLFMSLDPSVFSAAFPRL